MNLLSRAREAFIRRGIRRAARHLATADADLLSAGAREQVLRTFQTAAVAVPAYRHLLEQNGVVASKVDSLEAFHRLVPVIDKRSWFGNDLRQICTGGNLDGVASFFSSSGHSGLFSYGVETRKEQQNAALSVEFALQQAFGALDRKTLLINCLPMGVRLHTRSLAIAETSVREDVIWSLLRKLSGEFEQFVLIGEHPFLKHMIEGAIEGPEPIDWQRLRIHIVTGAEYVAENFRTYLASLLGIDIENPSSGVLLVNYGLSELSVSIAQENWHTIQIRRLANGDPRFRKALFGDDSAFCPNVMQYYPSQVYLETLRSPSNREELIVTMLDEHRRMPIVRYNTGDCANIKSHAEIARLLRDFDRADLIPPLRLPFVVMRGKCVGLPSDSGFIYPEIIKEALYSDMRIAASVTGNFRLSDGHSGPQVLIQLKPTRTPIEIQDDITRQIAHATGQPITVEVVAFVDYPFGIRHDFERKNQYLDSTWPAPEV